jgi:glycosyltransferase involved in cell wall biosynthesis
MRLAFIVSHPIQYYVPVYRGLAERIRQADERPKDQELTGLKGEELERPKDESLGDEKSWRPNTDNCQLSADDSARISALKVFYTWRDAGPARDVKFGKEFAWDIPLMEGYDFEVVPNTSLEPGTHHRQGLINPDLVARVKVWKPDAVHITGYNYVSHGQAIKELSKAGIPVIFRGDSHLLDDRGPWWKWWIKKIFLSRVYRRPSAFAYVGQANRDYYRSFGVPERKLFPVPHTIEVGRFAEPNEQLEAKALVWRRELGIPDDHFVFLYAAKLEPRKRPMELLEAFLAADVPKTTLLFVGSGELEGALKERVERDQKTKRLKDQKTMGPGGHGTTGPTTEEKTEDCKLHTANCGHCVLFLPFQNQSRMPLVYRLGDALVLPSGYWETWGLAVNEAQACGRPSLVSDCVGCARDIVREGENGMIFRTDDWKDCVAKMKRMVDGGWRTKRDAIRAGAWKFDTARGVEALLVVLASASKTTRPKD